MVDVVAVEEYDEGANKLLVYGIEAALASLGVGGGRSIRELSPERSSLLPTSRSDRFGEASALASLRNGCRFVKVL